MSEVTLAFSAAFALVTAIVYAVVGLKVGRPNLTKDERRAVAMFKLWWHGLAGLTFVSAAFLTLGVFGRIHLALFQSLLFAELVVICLALWGLAYYLFFLFTGRTSLFYPLGIFYGLLCVWLFYLIVAADPIAVDVTRWQVTLEYADEDRFSSFSALFVLLLIGPQLAGAIAYFTLFFRTDERRAKYRIAMVSLSLIVWLGSGIVAGALGVSENDGWMVASRFISLAAALVILMAYRPPVVIARRLEAGGVRAEG